MEKKKAGTAQLLLTVLKERHRFNMTHLSVDSSECFLDLSYRQAMACLCRSQPVEVVVQKGRSQTEDLLLCGQVHYGVRFVQNPRRPYQDSCPPNVCVTVTNLFYVVAMGPT